ncbi:MAG: sn-glycerol-1-phosphate dehydrogenase [Chloroflexota bacterium]|nr:sn-glycerol-1-phosphate dehydrogenase [Chloroflexota bacterium]
MDDKRIHAALRAASDTHHLLVGTSVLNTVDDVLEKAFGRQPVVIVADDNTYAIAGKTVYEHLRSAQWKVEEPVVFPGTPALYADFENVLTLEEKLRATSAVPVVVGSGTLNDITKLASHRARRQYMCVSTAASMDGYTAFGAAITRDGFKQTMMCPAPRAVVADLDVLVSAPAQMNSAGYGDLLGKVTAGADWILADALEIEPIEQHVWSLVQDSLRDWTGRPLAVHAGDRQAIENLFEGLILSGVAMQMYHSSRTASGSEHQFSHLWEMQALAHDAAPVPHGFKVGIGSIAIAALYEQVLARDLTRLDSDALCRAWPSRKEVERSVQQRHSIPKLAENAVQQSLAKYISPEQLRQRLLRIQERWSIIKERLERQLMTAEHIRALLRDAGCPTKPAEVGISTAQLRETYTLARTIRSRYTVLDLAYEAGILDACVDELFAPGGYWAAM